MTSDNQHDKKKHLDLNSLTCYTDLHLHLDGSLSVANVRALAKAQNMELPKEDADILKLLQAGEDCRDLNEFLEKFEFPNLLLQTAAGLQLATENLLREINADGVMYAEIRFAPQNHTLRGLTQEVAVKAVLAGLRQAAIPCGIILCAMRGADRQQQNLETVALAEKYLGQGVCALDLAGAEALYPTADYAAVFSQAKKRHVPFTIHAGEADGPESIRAALDFGAVRIGHGIRSIEDPTVVKRLARNQIPLECCPTSNLITSVLDDLSAYPIRELTNAGVIVTINTDDMSVCGTNIRREWHKLSQALSLTPAEIEALFLNGVNASFASDTQKELMRQRIQAQFHQST